MLRMGLGTGHFIPSSSSSSSSSPPFRASVPASAAASSLSRCLISTARRLEFSASALGQDRESSIRRTARLDAVFSARVSEWLCDDVGGAAAAAAAASGSAADDGGDDDPPLFLSLVW